MIPFQRDHDLTTLEKKMGQSIIGCQFRETRANRGCRLAQNWQLVVATDSRHQFNVSINYDSLHHSVCGQRRDNPASWRFGGSEKNKMKR